MKNKRRPSTQSNRLKFVQQMIVKLRTYLLSSEPVISVDIDGGGVVTYDRKGAWEMLQELENEERRILQPRRLVGSVDLREAFG